MIPLSYLFFGGIWILILGTITLNGLILIPYLFFKIPFKGRTLQSYWDELLKKYCKSKVLIVLMNIIFLGVMCVLQWYWILFGVDIIWGDLRSWYWDNLYEYFEW